MNSLNLKNQQFSYLTAIERTGKRYSAEEKKFGPVIKK